MATTMEVPAMQIDDENACPCGGHGLDCGCEDEADDSCPDCDGDGYGESSLTGRAMRCRTCDGTGVQR